jgi:hypothetical protein
MVVNCCWPSPAQFLVAEFFVRSKIYFLVQANLMTLASTVSLGFGSHGHIFCFFENFYLFEKWGLIIEERRAGLITGGHSPSTGADSPNVEELACPIVYWFQVPGTGLVICSWPSAAQSFLVLGLVTRICSFQDHLRIWKLVFLFVEGTWRSDEFFPELLVFINCSVSL